MGWTCSVIDASTTRCTLNGAALAASDTITQGVWTAAGLVLAAVVVGAVIVLFMGRIRG